MPRLTKMTTARLTHSHIRWLRDLAEQEGNPDLARTCDVAMSGSSVPLRDLRAAQKRCVDEINTRTGYTGMAQARQTRALSKSQIAADVRQFLENPHHGQTLPTVD